MPACALPRVTPLSALAGALVAIGTIGFWTGREPPEIGGPPCDPDLTSSCESTEEEFGLAEGGGLLLVEAPVRQAEEACRNVGYLCSELERTERIRIQRWKNVSGVIVVHVPRPDFEDPGDAARLQQAAASGLRAWNGEPFEIYTDLQGTRQAHFAVRWTRNLGGSQIGVARTQWSPVDGLSVVSVELATRTPFSPQTVIDPRQVRLTAAHEMGHALGLPHSDAPRDVMYPTNTATSLSAQDYRSMEALYLMEDGTEIRR